MARRGRSRIVPRIPRGVGGAVLLLAALSVTACFSADRELPGKKIFERVCSQCHSTERVMVKNKDVEGWRRTVAAMRARGAKLNDEEAEWVVEYLHTIRPEK
jgi:mono/diheme cytochrome c family protein